MRVFCIAVLWCGFAFAQLPQVPQLPQQAVIPDDKVVATVDGKQYTAGQIRAMEAGLPPQGQQAFAMNPAGALQQLLMTRHLAEEAEKQQLDKESPYKEQLEYQREFFLATTEINKYANAGIIHGEDQEKYYKDHPEDFEQAKVRVIYIAFSSGQVKSEKKALTEAEAKAKAQDLRKQLQAGADFAQLARQYSEDKESAAKGGEWGLIKRSSRLPEDVKSAVFALKPGEVSQPLKEPNGFYLIKLDEFSKQPYNDVSSQIADKLRQERLQDFMKDLQKRFTVKVEDPDFFPHQPAAPASH